jgi:DNA-binding NarL/FixJ family response regulator
LIATDGEDLLSKIKKSIEPDIVLLDIEMLGMDGFETAIKLKQSYPTVKIIVLSMHSQYSYIKRMLSTGVDGYLLKNSDAQAVKKSIRTVFAGGLAYNSEALAVLRGLTDNNENTTIEMPNFSDKELEIIRLVSQEFSNIEIADKMFRSKSWAEASKREIFRKMGVKNSIGLMNFAIKHRLV